ncbi:hypothetical protein CRG98_035332 [Punica granatum]|uniref:G-patch domain-containing protein n=1 Tax=Punica granatum TaxID=22663 RepID=A0A2I0IJS0_PUNGR|nr:hypothetical protein CRG98_035332 [Punica granatum]
MSVMGMTRSGRVYENPIATNKGKAPAAALEVTPVAAPVPQNKVTEEEAKAFMKVIKGSEYKIVEQMGKSSAHISLLALLLSFEPHREALLKVLTSAQVPREIAPDMIEETVGSIFSSNISFSEDELPSEGYKHTQALHIVCKCNQFIIGQGMIDNGSALNVCTVSTLKQMNVDMSRIKPSKTAIRAFDGSRREVNGEIDLQIEVGPCSFNVTFQVLDIPNAFSLLLERPWINSAGAIPSSLHQKLKFIVEENLITVKGEEDCAIYKETAVPYISIGDDQNLSFYSFETISVIKDYGEIGPSVPTSWWARYYYDYVPGTGLEAHGQGITRPIEIEEYKNNRGLGFRPSCHEILQAHKGRHLHHLAAYYGKLNRGIPVPPLSQVRRTSSGTPLTAPPRIQTTRPLLCQPSMPSPRRLLQGPTSASRRRMRNSTTGPQCCATRLQITFTSELHSNLNHRCIDSNPSEERLEKPQPIYFEEGLDENDRVPEIEESLHRLEDYRLTSVEPIEEINVGTEEEPHILKIGTGLDPTQRARMIDFLKEYQEVFAWSYTDMPGLDPSIVRHFLPLDTERFPPK